MALDLPASVAAKDSGQALVESHEKSFVTTMRSVAASLAREKGSVTADDLRQQAAALGIAPHHPNAWGSIFRGPAWQCVGYTRSALKSNHARTIRIWSIAA